MHSIQERLRERRLACGLTLLDIAEKLGVKEATVQRYESGEIKNIKHETIVRLSDIFHCSPSYLMGWTNEISDIQYKESDFTSEENALIIKYRSLDQRGQQAVQDTLNREFGYSANSSNADIATDMLKITEGVDIHIINQLTPTDKK